MAIVAFRNIGEKKAGNTLSLVAIATNIAIKHNYKILIISTEYDDETINKCFWKSADKKMQQSYDFLGNKKVVNLGSEIDGLIKLLKSNKLTPETIKDYTKVVLKGRLEVLTSCKYRDDYEGIKAEYLRIMKLANQAYDLVLVDVGKRLEDEIVESILKEADIVVNTASQKRTNMEKYISMMKNVKGEERYKQILLLTRYDFNSKYNVKNLIRLTKEREIFVMPYNTLYFDAAEEEGVIDLFFRIGRKDATDENAIFRQEVDRITNEIVQRVQETRM